MLPFKRGENSTYQGVTSPWQFWDMFWQLLDVFWLGLKYWTIFFMAIGAAYGLLIPLLESSCFLWKVVHSSSWVDFSVLFLPETKGLFLIFHLFFFLSVQAGITSKHIILLKLCGLPVSLINVRFIWKKPHSHIHLI